MEPDILAYREILHTIPVPIIIAKPDGSLVFANLAVTGLYGYSEDEIKEITARNLFVSYDEGVFKSLSEGRMISQHFHKRGHHMDVIVDYKQVVYAGEICLLLCIRDISRGQILQNELRSASMTDPLTRLYNRNFLDELFGGAFEGGLGVILVDVDHFKHVNDSYGHSAGDRVLQELARLIVSCVRKEDSVIRFGGEEFVIILYDCWPESCSEVAERVRKRVEEETFLDSLHLSISAGVVWTTVNLETTEEQFYRLLQMADLLLYQAKNEGRNRVKTREIELKSIK